MFPQQTGMTALHYAANQKKAEVVNALLKAGSKVDEKDQVSMLEISGILLTQCLQRHSVNRHRMETVMACITISYFNNG